MKINKFYKQKFNNAFPILSVTNLPYIWILDNFSDNSELKKY